MPTTVNLGLFDIENDLEKPSHIYSISNCSWIQFYAQFMSIVIYGLFVRLFLHLSVLIKLKSNRLET